MSRRQHVAVAGNVWRRVLVTCARTHDTMASAAQCAWQSVVFRFVHTGVVNDVSRVIDCAQKFVFHVNELLSLHRNTCGRQRAVRVPKVVLKLAFMEHTHTHTSQRLFGTSVCVCFFLTAARGLAERHHEIDSICFLMVALRAHGTRAETYDEGMPFPESTWKSPTRTYVRRAY